MTINGLYYKLADAEYDVRETENINLIKDFEFWFGYILALKDNNLSIDVLADHQIETIELLLNEIDNLNI